MNRWGQTFGEALKQVEKTLHHFEISPREREDEDRRHRRDFDTDEQAREDMADRIRRSQEGVPDEE